jgi:4-carboxymuconolactone decarboxylase
MSVDHMQDVERRLKKTKIKKKTATNAKSKPALIRDARAMLCKSELTDAITEAMVNDRGDLGYVLSVLKERPRTFNPYLLKGMTVYKEPKALDRKTAELIAVSAAAALHCEHCLEAHMARAIAEGATLDEIMDTLLVAGSIAESSLYSVAFRKYKQLEGKMKKGGAGKE